MSTSREKQERRATLRAEEPHEVHEAVEEVQGPQPVKTNTVVKAV
jgi:hypothetical protein